MGHLFQPKIVTLKKQKIVLKQIPLLHWSSVVFEASPPNTPVYLSDKFIIQDHQNSFFFIKPRCTLWSDSCKGQQSCSSLGILMKHLRGFSAQRSAEGRLGSDQQPKISCFPLGACPFNTGFVSQWIMKGLFLKGEVTKKQIRWSLPHSKTGFYLGVSLNGGTPKTPQNDHL